ncbi:MAG: hypothetical protein ACK56Q_02230, partial [Pirellulaceae bacterium]
MPQRLPDKGIGARSSLQKEALESDRCKASISSSVAIRPPHATFAVAALWLLLLDCLLPSQASSQQPPTPNQSL